MYSDATWYIIQIEYIVWFSVRENDIFSLYLCSLQVIAESLSEEEIAGLKEMFKMIDADNSGQITFEELKAGMKRVGANLKESEIYDLMQAVSIRWIWIQVLELLQVAIIDIMLIAGKRRKRASEDK